MQKLKHVMSSLLVSLMAVICANPVPAKPVRAKPLPASKGMAKLFAIPFDYAPPSRPFIVVRASICRETGMPFQLPGSAMQWDSLTDMTDARLLARHLELAATTDTARNHAFNVVNGDVFRWKWMWEQIADWFGIGPAPFTGEGVPLEQQLTGIGSVREEIAKRYNKRYNLIESNLEMLVSPWHTDADLGHPIAVVTDMSKSRQLGFTDYQATRESFFDLFTQLRNAHIIP